MTHDSHQITFENREANPPILIVPKLTKSPKKYSSNLYLDPEDMKPFEVRDLTPIEKGHVYQYIQTKASVVEVHMPLRVMDRELAHLLTINKCFSFRSFKDSVKVHRNTRESSKKFNSCIQDFTLNVKDFKKFMEEATKLGFSLRSSSVNVIDLLDELTQLEGFCQEIAGRTAECRSSASTEKRSLEEIIGVLKTIEASVTEFKLRYKTLIKNMDLLKSEYNRDADTATVEYQYEQVKQTYQTIRDLSIQRVSAECIYDANASGDQRIPGFIVSL